MFHPPAPPPTQNSETVVDFCRFVGASNKAVGRSAHGRTRVHLGRKPACTLDANHACTLDVAPLAAINKKVLKCNRKVTMIKTIVAMLSQRIESKVIAQNKRSMAAIEVLDIILGVLVAMRVL